MPSSKAISEYLNRLKDERGWTAQRWSEESGVPAQTVSRLLNAQTDAPGFDTVAALVKSAGGSLDDLAGIPRPVSVEREIIQAPSDVEFIRLQTETVKQLRRASNIAWGIVMGLLIVIFGVIIYDICNLNVGWVRQQMSHYVNNLIRFFRG